MTSRKGNRYLTTTDIGTLVQLNRCNRINETSKYPIHLINIDQDFMIKYVRIYLQFGKIYNIPRDLLCHMFSWLFKEQLLYHIFIDDVQYANLSYYTELFVMDTSGTNVAHGATFE